MDTILIVDIEILESGVIELALDAVYLLSLPYFLSPLP